MPFTRVCARKYRKSIMEFDATDNSEKGSDRLQGTRSPRIWPGGRQLGSPVRFRPRQTRLSRTRCIPRLFVPWLTILERFFKQRNPVLSRHSNFSPHIRGARKRAIDVSFHLNAGSAFRAVRCHIISESWQCPSSTKARVKRRASGSISWEG